MNPQEHWNRVYTSKAPDQVSWYRPHLDLSCSMIVRAAGGDATARIADAGGGASSLPADLIARGYRNISVLDISQAALDVARLNMDTESAAQVDWRCTDVTKPGLPRHAFDIWHDRAVFHFLTSPEDRSAYVRNVAYAVKPGGHVIVGTIALDGPAKCSGLEVVRYDAESLHNEFGVRFQLLESTQESHETPFGTRQQFLYCFCTLHAGGGKDT